VVLVADAAAPAADSLGDWQAAVAAIRGALASKAFFMARDIPAIP